jgi:hypothetical protein
LEHIDSYKKYNCCFSKEKEKENLLFAVGGKKREKRKIYKKYSQKAML